ncbi:MAG TPA: DNA polymerase III subunit alpha [Steroidobacteraceae bacterium]|nr:DNA polymerase III subunit alpha [Steroidobacteraceae bacterium]
MGRAEPKGRQPQFVHLRLHTEYSLVDGIVRVPRLMPAIAAAGMAAVALTDQCNLFAMVKFYREALRHGIKPLIGVDIWLGEESDRDEPSRLTLLAQDLHGYRNLSRLISKSYLDGQARGRPVLERRWLDRESTGGLIALSGAGEGDVGRALLSGRSAEAQALLARWLDLFGDRYYLELQRTGRPRDEEHVAAVLALVAELPAPVVATNDVRFLQRADFEAHEARVCIHEGTQLDDPGRPRRYSTEQYLKDPAEMAELFADLPEAIANCVAIARRCSLELSFDRTFLPAFAVPKGTTVTEYLRRQAEAGLAERLAALAAEPALVIRPVEEARYRQRLAEELGVICAMGFEGYFLVVADFIRWAREHDIPVGPGRGSGAGSLAAWSLGITDLDPLQHDLLFERFLNPERVSLPDFDIDFCMARRDQVIDYVAGRYGRDRVSQIITFGSMAARAVVRDVGRVLGLPYGLVDSVAKLIPFELGITLDDALEKEPELARRYGAEDEVRDIIDLAKQLEGLARNAGTHAGGVVIAPSPLTDFAPLYREQGGTSVVTQFDKDDVEHIGLVKFDFLGLRTLTIIDWTVKLVNAERAKAGEPAIDIARLPLDDADTYRLLKSCRTTAIFQLESRGMKDLVRKLQPDCFDDIVALVALFRPGPLQSGMVDDFMARKHGRSDGPIDYLHPSLTAILKPTYGVILYQEQVMQIAQTLSGYTLGGADLLRRAMGKKKPEEMAVQRSVFIDGAVSRGVSAARAGQIFDLIEKFAGYGFNKSHSAAYALLAYQTAWLKAHYPEAFMAAVLSSDMDHTDKVVSSIDECNGLGLEVLPPDVNHSMYQFTVAGPGTIRYGLGAVKGVGQGAVDAIIEERTRGGPFRTLADLCGRVDLRQAGRRTLEAMVKAGCFDGFGQNRATLAHMLPAAMQLAEQSTHAVAAGQDDLFGGLVTPAGHEDATPAIEVVAMPEWSEAVRLAGERETLGLYLTGHPIAEYEQELRQVVAGRIADLGGPRPTADQKSWGGGKNVTIAGLVLELRRRGPRMTLILDDRSGRIEVSLFEDVWQQHRSIIARDAILVVEGQLRFDEFIEDWRLNAKKLTPIDELREREARRLIIRWPAGAADIRFIQRLEETLRPCTGGRCGVAVHYTGSGARATLALGEQWSVRPTRELLEDLGRLVGRDGVRLMYGPRAD